MAEKSPQTYANHAKLVPTYHFLLPPILLVNLGWTAWRLFQAPSFETVLGLLMAIAIFAMAAHLRIMPLTVQDRVIRLEMRLRLAEVLPEDLRGRIGELKRQQLVALRFASDAELPELVREVLEQGIQDQRTIKKKIRDWTPDHLRC